MAGTKIPQLKLSSGHGMPAVGMGTAKYPLVPENTKSAIIAAIEVGFRHFDTATLYGSELPLGEAIAEAFRLRLIESREELFITSKLWCTDCHPELVLPAIKTSLRNLQMHYLDLYLIHWPLRVKPGPPAFPINRDDVIPLELKGVWQAMEECQRLGLTRSIGVSNFTTGKLEELFSFAKIPPAVNQVEMNPVWQQLKLRKYCAAKGIVITAWSPLGGQRWTSGQNPVLDSEVLKEIAKAKEKSAAQVALRWLYEQGVGIVVKSFNKERLKQNLEIFDWELSENDSLQISKIPQEKRVTVEVMLSKEGSLSVDPADIDIIEL